MQFTITVDIQQLSYSTTTGEDVWNKISKLEIGPHKRIALSTNYQVRNNYRVSELTCLFRMLADESGVYS